MGWWPGDPAVICDGCGWWFPHNSNERNPQCLQDAGGAVKSKRNWTADPNGGRYWAHCPVCLLDMPYFLGTSIDPWHFGSDVTPYNREDREEQRHRMWRPPTENMTPMPGFPTYGPAPTEPEPENRSNTDDRKNETVWHNWYHGGTGDWQDWSGTGANAGSSWDDWSKGGWGGHGRSGWWGDNDKGYLHDRIDEHHSGWQDWSDSHGGSGGGRGWQPSWGAWAWERDTNSADNSYLRSLPDPKLSLENVTRELRSLQGALSRMDMMLNELSHGM